MKKLLEKLCFCPRGTRDAGRGRGRGRDWQGTTATVNRDRLLCLCRECRPVPVAGGWNARNTGRERPLEGKRRDAWPGTAMAALVLVLGGEADGDRGWREVVEKRCGPG